MRRCYILVRQIFFVSNGVHYQRIDDNPVVGVYTTAEAAKDAARRIIANLVAKSDETVHMVEQACDSELIYKGFVVDSSGSIERSYSVIKQGMLL